MPEPAASQPVTRSARLDKLHTYLSDLPPLASKENSDFSYCLKDFTVRADLEKSDGLAAAVNARLEVTFGTRAYGPVQLRERGPGLMLIVGILEKKLVALDKAGEDGFHLEKWLDDLIAAAEEVYTKAEVVLPSVRPRAPKVVMDLTGSDDPATLPPPPVPARKVDVQKESHKLANWDDSRFADIAEDRQPKRDSGAKTFPLLFKATRLCVRLSDGKELVRCVASDDGGCNKVYARPRAKGRILEHMVFDCPVIRVQEPEWRDEALTELTKNVWKAGIPKHLWDKAAKAKREVEESRASDSGSKKRRLSADGAGVTHSGAQPAPKKIRAVFDPFAVAGDVKKAELASNALVRFICCNLLTPKLLDTSSFREYSNALSGSSYRVPSSTTFYDSMLPGEAARVEIAVRALLTQKHNLTMTFDGGSLRRKLNSFVSVHISTAERETYMIELNNASAVRHTAVYYVELLTTVMKRIGEDRFAAVCSDDTGNTRKARRLLTEKHPHVLNLKDACHELANTLKELLKLPIFKKLIADMRAILKFMHQTILLALPFEEARERLGILRGLEYMSRTRFAGIAHCANSIKRNLPAFRDIMEHWSTEVELPDDRNCLLEEGLASIEFEAELQKLTSIGMPFARGIEILESAQSTASDVALIWFSILAEFEALFSSGNSGFAATYQKKMRKILQRRFKKMITEAPHDVYITAFLLDPRFRNAPVWKNLDAAGDTAPFQPLTDSRSARRAAEIDGNGPSDAMKRRVYLALVNVLQNIFGVIETREEMLKRCPALADIPPGLAKEILKRNFADFTSPRPSPIYDIPYRETDTPLIWWEAVLEADPENVLAVGAIKIFGITPNSMADERTASQVTLLNSANRNGQTVGSVESMIRVKQYHLGKLSKRKPTPPVVRWRDMSDIIQKPPLLKLAQGAKILPSTQPSKSSTTILSTIFPDEDESDFDSDYDPLADSDHDSDVDSEEPSNNGPAKRGNPDATGSPDANLADDADDAGETDDKDDNGDKDDKPCDLFKNLHLMAPILRDVLAESGKGAASGSTTRPARAPAVQAKSQASWKDAKNVVLFVFYRTYRVNTVYSVNTGNSRVCDSQSKCGGNYS